MKHDSLSNAELAILSLVGEADRHGYEIERVIDERGMRDWTALGFSSIYYVLKKLEQEGQVESYLAEAGRGPARKVYRITAAGRAALHAATIEALALPARAESPFLLGLANLPALTDDQALAAFNRYRDGLQARLEHLQRRHRRQQPLPPFVEGMFSYSFTMIEAELAWIERFSNQWRTNMSSPVATKIDLKRELKQLYAPSSKDFVVVEVPPMAYLMIDGQGDPTSSQAFQEATEVLYAVSYALKFSGKGQKSVDWAVMPLEGLWWSDDMAAFTLDDRPNWKWTAMIVQPDVVTPEMVAATMAEVAGKKRFPALNKLRFETYDEGLCAQILHVGPFSAEAPTIERLHRVWLPEHKYVAAGKHHEIYLSDPRRAAPETLKTILRQPIRTI